MKIKNKNKQHHHRHKWGPGLSALVLAVCLLPSPSYIPSLQAATIGEVTGTSTSKSQPTKRFSSPSAKKKNKNSAVSKKPVAQIVSVRKNVSVKKGGQDAWSKAEEKTSLNPADQIRTGSKSVARVKMHDGTVILFLQNSEAEMENLSTVQKAVKLLKGKIRAIVKRVQQPGAFQIKTPVGVASVRGTDFVVEFDAEKNQMSVDVLQGEVGVAKLGDLAKEVSVNPGEKIQFGVEGDLGTPLKSGAAPLNSYDVRREAFNLQSKQSILAMAAAEERLADYQVGKSMIDVDGHRVRIEEYIMRPAPDQIKLVALNERSNHFDYYTYHATFNDTLPTDLSVALKQMNGKLGTTDPDTKPDYYVKSYETKMSNTIDNITDAATDGHLVNIEYDGTHFNLSDPDNITNTRQIDAAVLQNDGTYKIYDPVKDTFRVITAAAYGDGLKISVLDPVSGSYRNLASGDALWKTRFNGYSYKINEHEKSAYAVKNGIANTLALDLDATFTMAPITTISENPSGSDLLHNRLSLYYEDGSKTVYDNYIIDDAGAMAPRSAFDGITTSAAYKNEMEKWNYQQKVTSSDMEGEINLVIDPRIGTMSGLIQ